MFVLIEPSAAAIAHLEASLAKLGLRYPQDPASDAWESIPLPGDPRDVDCVEELPADRDLLHTFLLVDGEPRDFVERDSALATTPPLPSRR